MKSYLKLVPMFALWALSAAPASAQIRYGLAGLWRLDAPSTMDQGCYPPCYCGVLRLLDDLQGSFRLSLLTVGDVGDRYEAADFNLSTPILGAAYSGSGELFFSQRFSEESMSAALSMNGLEAAQLSGSSPIGPDPDGMDLILSINGLVCYDLGLRFVAHRCRADWDRDGQFGPPDIAAFVSDWIASAQSGGTVADYDGNGAVEPADVAAMVNAWFSGLAGGSCA